MPRVHLEIPLRWTDLDMFDHVNNVAIVRLLEEARIKAFWRETPKTGSSGLGLTGDGEGAETISVVARQEIEYLQPMPYFTDPIVVELWIGRYGGASFDVFYEVTSPKSAPKRVVYTKAATTVVFLDAKTLRPRKLSETERGKWLHLADEPLDFRRA